MSVRRVARHRAPRRGPAGFTLVEVIIASTLLAVVMIMVATLATSVSRRGRTNELATKRTLALAQQVGRMQIMPWDDLVQVASGTTQLLVGDFTFRRRLVVTSPGVTRRIITVVIEPVGGEFRPDSVIIQRTRPALGTPMCSGC